MSASMDEDEIVILSKKVAIAKDDFESSDDDFTAVSPVAMRSH